MSEDSKEDLTEVKALFTKENQIFINKLNDICTNYD